MKKILSLRLILYFALLVFFALLPPSLIEGHSFCPLYLMTGFKCLGCGVTRGFCAFMHFDFEAALCYNSVFTCAVFPICIFLMLEDSLILLLRYKNKITCRSFLEQGVGAVFDLFKGR